MRKQAFDSQIAVFPLKPHVYCIKVRGRQDCFMVQWPSLPTSPPPESWLGDHRYPQSFYPKDFKQKLLFWKRPLILVPQSYAWSSFVAEGGHLFIYQLPIPMFKHDGAAFQIFTQGQTAARLSWFCLLLFPPTSQALHSFPEAAAGKTGGQLCVLATLPQWDSYSWLQGRMHLCTVLPG